MKERELIQHPNLKGSFTCLGNWYNLQNKASMDMLAVMLTKQGKGNIKVAIQEIQEAGVEMFNWKKDPCLWNLYNKFEEKYSIEEAEND